MSKTLPTAETGTAVTEARAAFVEAATKLAEGKARASAYKGRATEITARLKEVRRQQVAALAAAQAALDQYIGGECTEDDATAADARVEALAKQAADLEALADKVSGAAVPDLGPLIRARENASEWLSLAAIEDCIGDPLQRLTAALPTAFHAWLIARPDAVQFAGSHSEHQRRWPVFIASITPACPDAAALAAAKAELAKRVPEVA